MTTASLTPIPRPVPAPAPTPSSTRAAPPPLTRPGRDEFGDVFIATWRCLARAPFTFALLAIGQALLGFIAVMIPITAALAFAIVMALAQLEVFAPLAPALAFLQGGLGPLVPVGVFLAFAIVWLLNLQLRALVCGCAELASRGDRITLGAAARRTAGFFVRSGALTLLGVGGCLFLYGVLYGVATWVRPEVRPPTGLFPNVALLIGQGVVVGVCWYIGVRLYPLLPVLALDRDRNPVRAFGQAWRLTSGQVGRTIAWTAVVGSLATLGRVLCLLPIVMVVAGLNLRADVYTQLTAGWFALALGAVATACFAFICTPWLTVARTLYWADLAWRRPSSATLNWAPPTAAPTGGLTAGPPLPLRLP